MKREPGMAYDTKVLNKIFAVLSISFLLVTMWMFFDDYIRPWKSVQIKALDIQKQKIQAHWSRSSRLKIRTSEKRF